MSTPASIAQIDGLAATIGLRETRALPAAVDVQARLLLLDTLGCALAGRVAPEVAALEARLGDLESGGFGFPGGSPLTVRAATQLLAIGPTWHEACEGHAYAHGRPGIAAIAALLPLALQRDASLGEFLQALATGYEVGARAGGWLRMAPGLHVDGNWPALGSAAAVAVLLGMRGMDVMRAVSIAACQLPSSLYLPIRTGRNVRNLYLAHSATLGLDSALAAQAGVDAPPDALAWYAEHLCPAATAAPPASSADLILDAYLKPFAAVRHVHYGAVAARRIRARLRGEARDIQRIVLTVYEEATVYCGNPQPASPLAAQFSLSFGIAAMLRFGGLDAASYEPPRFLDAELRRLEALVEVQVDAVLTSRRERGAALTVFSAQGSFDETVVSDDPDLLLDTSGVIAKFVHSAAPLAPGITRSFATALLEAAHETRLRELWHRLSSPPEGD